MTLDNESVPIEVLELGSKLMIGVEVANPRPLLNDRWASHSKSNRCLDAS